MSRAAATGDWTSLGNIGIANGIQASVPIQAPINISGNAIGIGGSAAATTTGGANAKYCSSRRALNER